MRATDIVMDRVWQLEIETFHDTPGFVFAPITDVVEPAEDPTALHPEIQRQAANIRTDLDRFSPLEISSLVRHGYCVGRKACRARPDLFGAELPGQRLPGTRFLATRRGSHWPGGPARFHRALPAEDGRAENRRRPRSRRGRCRPRPSGASGVRCWTTGTGSPTSTCRSWFRSWSCCPYFVVKSYQRSQRINQLVESLSQGSRDLEVMSRLLEGPMKPWSGEAAEEVRDFDEPDFTGFEILQDSRIIDLRNWKPTAEGKQDSDFLGLWLSAVEGPQAARERRKQPLPRRRARHQSPDASPVPAAAAAATTCA